MVLGDLGRFGCYFWDMWIMIYIDFISHINHWTNTKKNLKFVVGWGGVQLSLKNNQLCGKYFFVVNALATPSNMLLNSWVFRPSGLDGCYSFFYLKEFLWYFYQGFRFCTSFKVHPVKRVSCKLFWEAKMLKWNVTTCSFY